MIKKSLVEQNKNTQKKQNKKKQHTDLDLEGLLLRERDLKQRIEKEFNLCINLGLVPSISPPPQSPCILAGQQGG